jgi:hypothetical protein
MYFNLCSILQCLSLYCHYLLTPIPMKTLNLLAISIFYSCINSKHHLLTPNMNKYGNYLYNFLYFINMKSICEFLLFSFSQCCILRLYIYIANVFNHIVVCFNVELIIADYLIEYLESFDICLASVSVEFKSFKLKVNSFYYCYFSIKKNLYSFCKFIHEKHQMVGVIVQWSWKFQSILI